MGWSKGVGEGVTEKMNANQSEYLCGLVMGGVIVLIRTCIGLDQIELAFLFRVSEFAA